MTIRPGDGYARVSGQAELVPNYVYGVRMFKIQGKKLFSVNGFPWSPDFNQAACGSFYRATVEEKYDPVDQKHMAFCECGFYACNNVITLVTEFGQQILDNNENRRAGYCTGILQGKGYASMGPRGFRVLKARIIAITSSIPQLELVDIYPGLKIYDCIACTSMALKHLRQEK